MRFFLFFLAFSAFAACNNAADTGNAAADETINTLWTQVMAVHDEVMPQMSNMNKLSKDLRHRLNHSVPADQAQMMQAAVAKLEAADDGMMTWMSNLKKPGQMGEDKSSDEIVSYYQQQLAEINAVKSNMMNSMEEAQKVIATLGAHSH